MLLRRTGAGALPDLFGHQPLRESVYGIRLVATFCRLILASLFCLAQLSLGAGLCLCPAVPQPPVDQKAQCPMHKARPCVCCCKLSGSGPATGMRGENHCQTGAVKDLAGVSQATIPVSEVPALPAALPAVQFDSHTGEYPVPAYLIVPRIRPPNPSLHGLRAPPAR